MSGRAPQPIPSIVPVVSVVVVSWNVRDRLRTCLTSVLAEAGELDLELIVVDNDSADDSVAMVRSEFPAVRLIANPDNRGFAAGCNQGLAVARGRFVLMLNPDTEVLDGAIRKAVAHLEAHPDWAVLGCQVLLGPDRIQPTCFSFPGPLDLFLVASGLHRLLPRSRLFGRPELSFWDRTSEREVDVVTGMFMLVRRAAIEEVGGMDEAYFVYAEEADWCYRFRQAGWKCVFSPVGQVIHFEGGGHSTVQVRERMFVQLQKSLLIFNRKHYGPLAAAWARLVFVGSSGARALLWTAMLPFRGAPAAARLRCNLAALRFHLTGREPRTAAPAAPDDTPAPGTGRSRADNCSTGTAQAPID